MPPAPSLSRDHSAVQHEAFCMAVHSVPGDWGADSQNQTSSRIGMVRLCFPERLGDVRVSVRDESLAAIFCEHAVYPDFSKAFDTVSCGIPQKLIAMVWMGALFTGQKIG